jgi:hypothetical protein
MKDPLGNIPLEQIPIGENFYTWNPLILAVRDPIGQLLIDQWLAVTVQMDQTRATLDTLFDDRFEDILLHVGLRTTDGRSRAKHAVGLAMIRRFNPNRLRKRLTQKRHGIGDYI